MNTAFFIIPMLTSEMINFPFSIAENLMLNLCKFCGELLP
jgi:hypothetical protein